MSAITNDYDYEDLAERLPLLIEYALAPPAEGQNRWRVMGEVREPRTRQYVADVLAATRRTADGLREMVALLPAVLERPQGRQRLSIRGAPGNGVTRRALSRGFARRPPCRRTRAVEIDRA